MTSQWTNHASRAGLDLPASTLLLDREELPAGAHTRAAALRTVGAEENEAVARQFKKAMRRLTSTVAIVATREHASCYGMSATAITSVCTEPPALLICINRTATLYRPLMRTLRFSVNLLHEDQVDLIAPFSGKLEHDARFVHGSWSELHGQPVLDGAQATLLCEVDGGLSYGSHDVVIGRVVAVMAADGVAPLLWQDGGPAVSRAR
jgi:flavin reductase (DIM6/NTAB) family NADH-FMN oxidoreductase RutF